MMTSKSVAETFLFILANMCCLVCGKGESTAEASTGLSLSPTHKIILYTIATGTFIILGIWLLCRSKRFKLAPGGPTYMQFEAQELSLATRGYHQNNLISSTQWGSLFKAVLQDGLVVAVKRLNLNHSDEANRSFKEVCNVLNDVRHRNLVRILGFTLASNYKQLVVEYLDWQTLDQLFCQNSNLSWETRLKIVQGTASALVYLHEERGAYSNGALVHGNLEPSNIFVDLDNQEPLLSDYGICSLIEKYSDFSSVFRGLGGYAAPECKRSEPVTPKSDVYSYGMITLQLLTLKLPTSEDVSRDLPEWVRKKLPHGLGEVIDPAIFRDATESEKKVMKRVLGVGLMCTRDDPDRRPSMKEVLETLIQIKSFRMNRIAAVTPGFGMEQV